ncbi:Nif3-like dinuclear metal center hexameric protein [Paraflavitalea speifideaquila]|uniref:Nif3-like dinuclear metal center hexameric protein n=1 Tax=Paraflavitalea speifideaquila TaxID=3076558 RepID=UPI0028E32899|nr:Nif3-like dinuclear metal center hexameric protein [Paraflavitalea speifideiaquila]
MEGSGTFKGGEGTNPFVGQPGTRHEEKEVKVEAIFPAWLQSALVKALIAVHPYEEVAYDVVELANAHPGIGAGLLGELPDLMEGKEFLALIKKQFDLAVIRHTPLTDKPVRKVALCGGAGSLLVSGL